MSDVTLPKDKLLQVMALCSAGSIVIEEHKARIEALEGALDDIRLSLDSQYGPDAWSINRILERVGK